MSEQRIPLSARSVSTLTQLETEARTVQMQVGAHYRALLDASDIDAATVADIKRDGDTLVVVLKDAVTADAD